MQQCCIWQAAVYLCNIVALLILLCITRPIRFDKFDKSMPPMNFSQIATLRSNSSDTFGALASGLCLLHCVATPLIFLAHAGTHDHHESSPMWWGMIDFLFLAISLVAIRYSAKKTALRWMPFALYVSWGLLAGYILIEKLHLFHLSHALIYFPALSLVFLHLYNRRHCRCEEDECCVPE